MYGSYLAISAWWKDTSVGELVGRVHSRSIPVLYAMVPSTCGLLLFVAFGICIRSLAFGWRSDRERVNLTSIPGALAQDLESRNPLSSLTMTSTIGKVSS